MAITHLKTFGTHSGFGQLIRQEKEAGRITMVDAEAGEVRYECRVGDTEVAGSGSTGRRAETYTRCETLGTDANNVTMWFALTYWVEAGPIPTNGWSFCVQSHGPNNTGQAQVALITLDGYFTLRLWDAATKSTIAVIRLKDSEGNDIAAAIGLRLHLIFRIVFHTSAATGRVEGWCNGVKYVDRMMAVHYTTDVNGNPVGPCTYLKEGLYTNNISSTAWRRMRGLRVGTAEETLESMAAAFPSDSGYAGSGGGEDPGPVAPPVPTVGAAPSGQLFGLEDGTTWNGCGGNGKRASAFTAAEQVDVAALAVWADGHGSAGSGSQVARAVIYADAEGEPGALLAEGEEVTVAYGEDEDWISFPFASDVRLQPGTYWLGLHTGPTSQVIRYAHEAAAGALRWGGDTYADGATTSWGATGTDDKRMTILALGTVVPAPGGAGPAGETRPKGLRIAGARVPVAA